VIKIESEGSSLLLLRLMVCLLQQQRPLDRGRMMMEKDWAELNSDKKGCQEIVCSPTAKPKNTNNSSHSYYLSNLLRDLKNEHLSTLFPVVRRRNVIAIQFRHQD